MVKQISRSGFQREILEGDRVSLVQFSTAWNGACQIIEPVFEDLARTYEGLAGFYKVDVDSEKVLATQYGIVELPTILFFHKGSLIDHAVGLLPKKRLIAKIEIALASPAD